MDSSATPDIAARLAPEQVKQRACAVSARLLRELAGSFGPRGRSHVVQANQHCADALTVTTSARRYIQSIRLGDCAVANTLLHILQSKLSACHADAGHLMVLLATSLLLEIQDGALSATPHYVVERGLQLSLTWTLAFLDDPRCPVKVTVDWSDETLIHAVIRGIVGAKTAVTGLDELAVDRHLVPLVLHTFLAVYEYAARFRNEKLPLHFVHFPRSQVLDGSRVLKGVVLLDRQWPTPSASRSGSRIAPPLKNVTVALFNVTIDPNNGSSTDEVSIEAADRSQITEFRLAALRRFADTLVKYGVAAVMSQKIIPTYLATYLRSKRIFVLDRLASSHIHAVQMLSGASLLSDWRLDQDPDALSPTFGFLSLISTEKIGRSKTFIRLERHPSVADVPSAAYAGRSWPVSTVLIAAPDSLAYEEIVESFNAALKVLSQLLEDPEVVAGAGCTEIHLAAWLQLQSASLIPDEQADEDQSGAQTRTLRQLQRCVRTFASLLTRIVGTLSQERHPSSLATLRECNAYLGPIIEQLESMNRPRFGWESVLRAIADRRGLFGWNPATNAVDEVLVYEWRDHDKAVTKSRVLDSLQCKRDAIVYAVECALVLMRISSVVKVQ